MLNFHKLELLIQKQINDYKISGLAISIIRNNEIMYSRGFGVTNIEEANCPVTPKTLFRTASITKALTGSAIMRLVDMGNIELDKPIKEYIPWLKFNLDRAEEKITMRMLLNHRTGLHEGGSFFGSRSLQGLEEYVREELPIVDFVAPPDKLFSYSKHNINLAGYIAEVIYKKSFPEMMKDLIFEPLEMSFTTFDPLIAMTYSFAQPHCIDKNGKSKVIHRFSENTALYPSYSAISNVMDLSNFAIMHLNMGLFKGKQIVSEKSIKEMHKAITDLYMVKGDAFGLTFDIENYKELKRVWITGGMRSYYSSFVMSPEKKLAIIILSNGFYGFWWLNNLIFDKILELPETTFKPKKFEADKSLCSLFKGKYLGDETGLAEITYENEELVLVLNGKTIKLIPYKDDSYYGLRFDNGILVSVGFILEKVPLKSKQSDEKKKVEYITINGCPCKRIEEKLLKPDMEVLEKFSGEYIYDEFDTITIYIENGKLILRKEKDEVVCTPISTNLFFADGWGLIKFRNIKKDKTTELVIQNTYVHHRSTFK